MKSFEVRYKRIVGAVIGIDHCGMLLLSRTEWMASTDWEMLIHNGMVFNTGRRPGLVFGLMNDITVFSTNARATRDRARHQLISNRLA